MPTPLRETLTLERLEINLATGRAQMFSAVPSTAGGTAGQRVRAVFTPTPEPAAGPSGKKSSGGDPAAAQIEPAPPKAIE